MKRCCLALSLLGAVACVLATLEPRSASASGLAAETLFSDVRIDGVTVSPGGEWALAQAVNGEVHGLLAQRLGSGRTAPIFSTREVIRAVHWVGDHSFVVLFATHYLVLVAHIDEEGGVPRIEQSVIRVPGAFVAPLPLLEDVVLWQFEDGGRNSVHRVRVQDLVGYNEQKHSRWRADHLGETLGTVRGSVTRWVVDRRGNPLAALRQDEGTFEILTRSPGASAFREVYSFEESSEADAIYPMSVAPSGAHLIVLAYGGHDTMGIHEFAPESGTLGARIFGREDVDVSDVVFDPIHGDLIAAVYEEGGERRFHYIDGAVEGICGEISTDSLSVSSRSADRKVYTAVAEGPMDPGTWHLCNTATGSAAVVAKVAAGVEASRLSEVQTLEVTSQDGTRVEAFLTLPADLGGDAAPLVVYPHGGPIGVRDSKVYEPLAQYLASWGFAVLQVNYRGSSGYGRKFEEAGKREWAQGIEDDIDAAVEWVVRRTEIDGKRICVVGGSYGGFSALASILRHPARYRCAVTINGVTDVPLAFETSDFADDARVLRSFAEVVGDVETERPRLLEISPVYDVRRMQTPVYVIYGTEDRRVDPEHSHRLLLVLDLLGKKHDSLEVEGGRHFLDRRAWIVVARSVRRYLTRYLFPSRTFQDDSLVSAGPS